MRSKHKALLLTVSMALLLCAAAFGTLAYLTDTDAVRNTFTVGRVDLTLDEADVKPDGAYETTHDSRVQANEYHLLPGHTYFKDPTVTVEGGSEDAYVRMIVTVENIDLLKRALPVREEIAGEDGTSLKVVHYPENEKYYAQDGTFLLQLLCGGWDPETWVYADYTESEDGKTGSYEFRYKQIVPQSASDTVLPDLFETITVPGEIDGAHLVYLKDVEIIAVAHAIQADGFEESADKAWEAFDADRRVAAPGITSAPATPIE